jgi:hypothetical protein
MTMNNSFKEAFDMLLQVKRTLFHILGLGLRGLSDILLKVETPEPTPVVPKRVAQEPRKKKFKVQRSEPLFNNTFYICAIQALSVMKQDINKEYLIRDFKGPNCTEGSLRTACKQLVQLRILKSSETFPAKYSAMIGDQKVIELIAEYSANLSEEERDIFLKSNLN